MIGSWPSVYPLENLVTSRLSINSAQLNGNILKKLRNMEEVLDNLETRSDYLEEQNYALVM